MSFHKLPNGDLDLLSGFLRRKLPHFCLPRHEVQSAYAATTAEDFAAIDECIEKARNLLITARKAQKRAGEVGELILFLFLEHVLGAPRIACKMSLKTSGNVPVHGSDAIHAKLVSGHLKVLWGESKVYGRLNSALSELKASILTFLEPSEETGSPPRQRDVEIIRDHLEVEDKTMRSALLDYFDPYHINSNELREGFGCLLIFDASLYDGDEAEREEKWIEENVDALVNTVQDLLIDLPSKYDFDVFLLPVAAVADLRKAFFRRIGVGDAE